MSGRKQDFRLPRGLHYFDLSLMMVPAFVGHATPRRVGPALQLRNNDAFVRWACYALTILRVVIFVFLVTVRPTREFGT